MKPETLIANVARHTGEPAGIVEQIQQATILEIRAALDRGEAIQLPGLGTFRIDDVDAHPQLRERTGEIGTCPAFKKIDFRPVNEWRKWVNRGLRPAQPGENA